MREFRGFIVGVLLFFVSFCLTTAHIRVDAPEEHNAPKYKPSFIRSAIESIPKDETLEPSSRYSMAPTFGEIFLPLRSAVESIPTISTRSIAELKESPFIRSFVRDAVEAFPENVDDDYIQEEEYSASIRNSLVEEAMPENIVLTEPEPEPDFEVETIQEADDWLMSDKYTAFIIPNKNKDDVGSLLPQPFRSDSPYQQLVKPSEMSDEVKVEDVAEVRDKISGYGALSHVRFQKYNDGIYKVDVEDNRPYGALAQIKDSKSKQPHKNFNSSPEVLCYITNWAFYRKADGQFVPEYLKNKNLCTKLIYSFASLDPDHLNIKEFDPWVDIDNQFYSRMVETGVPVLIAMGGWTDSFGDKYSRLAADDIKRKVFASNLVGFLQRHGFSGLHLDWNYPKCWQSDCSKGPATDKPNLTKLLREIRNEFERVNQKLKLGVAISGYKEIIHEAYEFPELSKIVDYMTVMSYDYHGAWERQTGHVSPLYGRKGDKYPQYNTDYTMQLLLKLGAKKERIIMGIPFYGQTFTLEHDSAQLVGEGTPAIGPGEAGEFTKQPGMLAYYEICQRVRKQKWLIGRDSERKSGPFAMLRNQWVGYEDPASVEAKARYAVNAGFGGVSAWTVDLDDFQNRCCSESFPLLKAINRAMGRENSEPPTGVNCAKPPVPVTPVPPAMTTISSDGSSGGAQEGTTASTAWQTPTMSTSTTPKTSTVWWTPSSTTTTTTPRPTQKPAQIPQNPTTIPAPAVVRPVVQASNCVPGEFYPDPYNCNSYYQCIVAGEIRQQFCSGGLHWNNNVKNCDWPASAKCTVKKKPQVSYATTKIPARQTPTTRFTTTRKPTHPTPKRTTTSSYWSTSRPPKPIATTRKPNKPQRPPPSARCNEGEYYTHRNCGKYYICINGILVPNSCGADLHWDGIRKICDWPENVKCVTTKKYLRIVQSKSSPEDPCNGEEIVPYPGDCTKYLFCLWNRLQAADCAPGLHFNAATGQCDWPNMAKCNNEAAGGDTNEIHVAKPKPAPTTAKPSTTTSIRPTYPTNKPNLEPLDGYYKVVCYFTNWAWYRKGLGRYTPDDIYTDLCTHVVYGFAVLDYSELILRTHDSWADIDNNFYTRVTALKNKGVKVSLALGGWNDSQGDKYSRLVRSPAARARFIKHSLEFLEKYGFEGLDLDWEYPVCWQTDCKKGMADEKEGFTALVRELSEEFVPRGLLLSTAVSPSKVIIDAGYDVPELSKYFDWIAVMTYDFHGQWDKKTGHVAPLYYHPDDDYEYFNANYSLHYWIEKGAPSRKIVMGMPLYGQSFTLENAQHNGLNAKAPGPGKAGEFTRADGFLAYYEICDRVKHAGWEVVQDKLGRMGPFARKGNQWVSYDDKAMIRKKSQLVRSMNLGGGMVWALDLDDFRNRCGEGVHPLLTQIHDILKDPPTGNEPAPGMTVSAETESVEEISTSQEIVYPMDIETGPGGGIQEFISGSAQNIVDPSESVEESGLETVTSEQESGEESNVASGDFKVVCYFTNWAWYRQGGGKFLPEDIDADLCSHIVYGFAVLNRDTLTIQPHDSWADLDNKFYERVAAYRKKGIKVTVAIGGWNDSAGDKYSRLVRSSAARARFISHVKDFIEKYGFDGLDLDWEYPVCWQVDCKKGTSDEKKGFADLVRELSDAFRPEGLLLSAAVSPNQKVIDAGYDVPHLTKYFDWIAVMAYDYHGQWDKRTGHLAPMYDHPDGTEGFNANYSINYWLERGADRSKLIMGMPMYGQSFSLAEAKNHDLNAPTYGGGEAGEATRARGFLSYYEICSYIRNKGWTVVRDARGRMGPYAFHRDQWVSFDDAPMIRHKSEYVKAMGLGGAMIWALDLDDFKNDCDCESYPLLKAINRVLRNYPGPHPKCVLESRNNLMISGANSKPTGQHKPKPSFDSQVISQKIELKPTKQTEISVSRGCQNRNNAPHESDCNKYYVCQHGELIEQKCPSGLYWNENYCDWPKYVKCTVSDDRTTYRPSYIRPKPTKPPTTKTPNKTNTSANKKPIPRPKPTPTPPPFSDKNQYKVVCYFTNWAWYRPGDGKYVPENIDENLCTHIVYGFAVLNGNSLTIKTHDSWADIDNHFYERVAAYKNKGLRVTVAIGGWNDSLGSKYARLVLDSEARRRFIESVLAFCEKYGFEGLDLDWEYPVCWQVDCSKGSSAEKAAFASLVRELSAAFKPRGLLLSAAVSPSKMVIDAGYEVSTLARYFDWISVMTYDFHGHWDKHTGHVAPLYYVEGDENPYFNGNFSINYWIEKGTPPEKLVMGMPLYGQSFALADANARNLNDKSVGPGRAGVYTRAAGFLAYYEICEQISNGGWTVIRDPQGRIGPYAYSGNQWVSYDDVNDIRRKSQFIKKMRLGGGMVWALDLDDFLGRCGCGKHPLLRTLNQELRGISGQKTNDCT